MLILIGAVPERLLHGDQSRPFLPSSLAPPGPAIGFSTMTLIQGSSTKEKAERWLLKQPLYQIYLPAPKYIPRPNASMSLFAKPNDIHQSDLLSLPHIKFEKKTYKYALNIVDVASRYKGSYQLTSKNADPIWSVDVYKIKDRYVQKHQPTLYYLDAGPKRSFVFEELQPIHDPWLLAPTLVPVLSALSGSSVVVCI